MSDLDIDIKNAIETLIARGEKVTGEAVREILTWDETIKDLASDEIIDQYLERLTA
jgi:hypothetical protein